MDDNVKQMIEQEIKPCDVLKNVFRSKIYWILIAVSIIIAVLIGTNQIHFGNQPVLTEQSTEQSQEIPLQIEGDYAMLQAAGFIGIDQLDKIDKRWVYQFHITGGDTSNFVVVYFFRDKDSMK